MNDAQTIETGGELRAKLDSSLKELEEALNDLSTIRSGLTAMNGYIDDMARAKTHIENAHDLLLSFQGLNGKNSN